MTFINILVCLFIAIILSLVIRGVILYVWSFFRPLNYIAVTVIDENGNRQRKKVYIKDKELLERMLIIRKRQKLTQGNNRVK
ncbi:hypothetical protein GYM75_06325 [Gilliamella sp. ESL0441]|uniref:hypothetical protein n=1 Tax=Gilliamella sp. ESL0441 TaxID=2704654 RepID=UPI001C6A1EAE|nr:hypothetical protein [Gilliamella sp. ESL0441]QYN44484.1 hypothetical protein GYM75_06325 [Gilliamella sp. ESL0441]